MCDTVVARDVMSGIGRLVCVVESCCVSLSLAEEGGSNGLTEAEPIRS